LTVSLLTTHIHLEEVTALRVSGLHFVAVLMKEDMAIYKYPSYFNAILVEKGLQPPTTYKDEKFA
jgi:hypothetical protein